MAAAASSAQTPQKQRLTDAPTNLKEAIDWVLRVTGRDGNNNNGECICGLAAAVTDLLQSVTLEYNGYQGDFKNSSDDQDKSATKEEVKKHLNELFSLVQGLGGTSVVRTYIDQLAQVLSALVGWSRIEKCWGKNATCDDPRKGHGNNDEEGKKCKYLKDVDQNDRSCDKCGCMKWKQPDPDNEGVQLGRRCKRCKGSEEKQQQQCSCSGGGGSGSQCAPDKECKCAEKGKCCKCCCNGRQCDDGCKKKGCTCDGYRSAYPRKVGDSWVEGSYIITWKQLKDTTFDNTGDGTPSTKRSQCAQILLGSVCLIWSGVTYMYWTGKYADSSPRWNNHILDGTGLDDGTLSQWLQALGFPREMLNDAGPGNRLDAVIWDGLMEKLFWGFTPPTAGAQDTWGNTAMSPFNMNYPGFVHTIHRDSFNTERATVFRGNDKDLHKRGALFKLYILSCSYFTGLQQKIPPKADNRTPKTIREILYWLSALPYSQAYKELLEHGKDKLKEVLKKPGESESSTSNEQRQLKFYQTGLKDPITVDEYNLFAHFQAVTQYCPLVLIGIQGGIHSTKGTDSTKEPAIHSLYANTECNFTYPTVDIQAYNQVVHYIRGLFYQLYFLRKQCAMKVALGGKWRECRYGYGVLGKGVVSWMCLGCSPMDHDRKSRVDGVKKGLVGVVENMNASEWRKENETKNREEKLKGANELITLLEAIGEVVVQLGNAQEALEGRKGEGIKGVKEKLEGAKQALEEAVQKLNGGLTGKLQEAKTALEKLTKTNGGKESGSIDSVTGGDGLGKATAEGRNLDPGKNRISEVIHKVLDVLTLLKEWAEQDKDDVICHLKDPYNDFIITINDLLSICSSPKCPGCTKHRDKCGQPSKPDICKTCLQPTTTGVPSPLQAFLEDRLPGFSCSEVLNDDKYNPTYPSAASHLGHCGGSGQCCPLPMGFRGQFYSGSISDCTGQRLYGILCFFSNENMMQSCVYTLVRVTAELSATTPQVLGDVFGFFRGGIGEKERGKPQEGNEKDCEHTGNPSEISEENKQKYFCGWCASGLREEVKSIQWIPNGDGSVKGGYYMDKVGSALIAIKGDKGDSAAQQPVPLSSAAATPSALSALTKDSEYLSPLTGELYTAVSATFGGTYLSWVLYLSDALEGGLKSLASEFKEIECRGCKGQCDPNKCKKGSHGQGSDLCGCQSIVSCTGVLPVLYRHGFSYGNPFNLEGYEQKEKDQGDYSIDDKGGKKHCHEFLQSLQDVIKTKEDTSQKDHPLTNLLSQVGQLQYDIRLPWIFVLTIAWLIAVLYLAFGAIWPLDWTHMRSHWLRGGAHQWQCMWYKVMTGRKGRLVLEGVEYFGKR